MLNSIMQSRFLRHVIALSSGTAIAQALALGLLPVLTRLYSPEDFGVLTLYVSIVGILSIFGSLRYELMILLPHSDQAAAQLVRLVFLISLAVSALSLLGVVAFGHWIASALGNPDIASWLFFLPFSLFLVANYQALRYWMMRHQKFGTVSQGLVTKTVVNFSSAIGLKGLGGQLPVGGGLVLSGIFSDLANLAWLLGKGNGHTKSLFGRFRSKCIGAMGRKYAPMAATLTVSHGIATVGYRLPDVMISFLFGSVILGFYGVAERVAAAPAQLIANAIGDVYRQRASVLYRESGRFDHLMMKTLIMTSALAIIPYSIGIWLAPDIFRILLGESWEEAGKYASIIMVGGFFSFCTTPVDKWSVIIGAKKYIIAWNIYRFVAVTLVFVISYIFSLSIYAVLWLLVAVKISSYIIDVFIGYGYASGLIYSRT